MMETFFSKMLFCKIQLYNYFAVRINRESILNLSLGLFL